MVSLLVWVGLPTLAGIVYYGFVAQPEYESVATLVLAGGSADAQAVILREHMLSRDALNALDDKAGFSAHYQKDGGLAGLGDAAGSESRYAYFRSHVEARYETGARTFTVRVRAFSGQAAQRFSRALIDQGMSFLRTVSGASPEHFVVAARPSLPTEAEYPRRGRGMLTVFLASLAIFSIGSLLIAAIREHAQF
jgi:capsule polysaccharide export protein KpsE/RkpR